MVHKGAVCASKSHTCRHVCASGHKFPVRSVYVCRAFCAGVHVCAGVYRLCTCEWLSLHGSVHGARVCWCVQVWGAQVYVQSLMHECACVCRVRRLCVHVCAQPPCAGTSLCTADVCVCVLCARVCASLLSSAGWSKPGAHMGHVHARLVPLRDGAHRTLVVLRASVVPVSPAGVTLLQGSPASDGAVARHVQRDNACECQPSCVHTGHGCTPAGALR